ncbi:hypothetical protein GH733_002275 [Mirounga leonina]|nr:hypothetical protein GH733_002275 [Mirounga leonina]
MPVLRWHDMYMDAWIREQDMPRAQGQQLRVPPTVSALRLQPDSPQPTHSSLRGQHSEEAKTPHTRENEALLCSLKSTLQAHGTDIVQWLMKNLCIEDPVEAIHLGSLIAAQGYIFPISDHVLTMKDDGTFYRFQAPYFWPSNCWEPENTDYAIYLCKRTMQNKARLELADYEAVSMVIFQFRIDRKKDKTERKILDSQERAFWDVHRPVPGCVNTTEMDIRKCRRLKNPQKVKKSVYGVTEESQSQSPVHIPSQPIRKTTKEDIRKQL